MKETGESGSTKNKTVILLLIILLILLWFVGEILVSYHWMKVNRYPVQVRNLRYADTVTDAGFKMVVISDLHDHEFGKDNDDPSDPWTDPSAGRRGCDRCIQRKRNRPECGDETFLRLRTSGKYDPFRYDC